MNSESHEVRVGVSDYRDDRCIIAVISASVMDMASVATFDELLVRR